MSWSADRSPMPRFLSPVWLFSSSFLPSISSQPAGGSVVLVVLVVATVVGVMVVVTVTVVVLVVVSEVPLVPVVEVVLVEVVDVVLVVVEVLVVVGGGGVQGENSDVLPSGAMAVAVITLPAG